MANEKRLIDANALKKAIREEQWVKDRKIQIAVEYIGLIIDEQPTVDSVEVVRCKDCKHYEIHRPKVLENCERNGYLIPMKPDDFCSYGERKDNG